MRVSLAEIQRYAKTLGRLSDLAAERSSAAIALWMTNHPDATVAECREFAIMAVRDAVTRYGDAAAERAATLYDEVMSGEGVDVPSAISYDGPDEGAIEGTVRRLVGKIGGDRPDVDGFLEQVRNLSGDKVRDAASETVMKNVERDARTKKGKGIRYARIPQRPDPCPWCVMLASRGFDYKSAKSAAAGKHHNCTCLVVAGIKDKTEVDGYDPKGMYDRYKSCEKTIGHDLQPSWDAMSPAEREEYEDFNDYCKKRVLEEMDTRDRHWLKTGEEPEYTVLAKASPNDTEKATAERLKHHGFKSEFRPTRGREEKRTADTFIVSGSSKDQIRTSAEYKQPTGDGRWTVFHQFEEASQQSRTLVIDITELEKPDTGERWNRDSIRTEVLDQIERTFFVPKGKHKGEPWEFKEVLLVSEDGDYCERFTRKSEIKN